MLQIVFIEVRVKINASLVQTLVILGTRQRRQHMKLKQIQRQFTLDDPDVAHDGFPRVVRKAKNVPCKHRDPGLLPGQQHLAVFRDLVLLFPCAHQAVRVDVLESDEDAHHSRPPGFFNELGDAVAHGVHLDHELDVQLFLFAHFNDAVEDALPVGIAREVIVSDEEALDALSQILPDNLFHVVSRTPARFSALHINDGAERALERTAAPGIEAGQAAAGTPDAGDREHGQRRSVQRGQIVHVVVERLERTVPGVPQDVLEAPFGFAREERNAEFHRLSQFRSRLMQHRQRAGYVEPPDANLNTSGTQRPRDVHGTRILIRLHSHQDDQCLLSAQLPGDHTWPHARIGLIDQSDLNVGVRRRHPAGLAVKRQPVHHRQGVRRNCRAEPLNRISVVVVMRGFDENQGKALHGDTACTSFPILPVGRIPVHNGRRSF